MLPGDTLPGTRFPCSGSDSIAALQGDGGMPGSTWRAARRAHLPVTPARTRCYKAGRTAGAPTGDAGADSVLHGGPHGGRKLLVTPARTRCYKADRTAGAPTGDAGADSVLQGGPHGGRHELAPYPNNLLRPQSRISPTEP